MYGMSARDAARLDAWLTREPPEPDFDCECEDEHDYCEAERCECVGHEDDCSMCGTSHGCRCDDLYEKHRDDRMYDEWEASRG